MSLTCILSGMKSAVALLTWVTRVSVVFYCSVGAHKGYTWRESVVMEAATCHLVVEELFFVLKNGELVHRAARQLGCLVLNLSFSNLGSIVGDNMARQQAWGGIVDRVKKKLSK
nr:RNA-directed DNA polymerase, eukaryota [Tanacetum cinerariifolium]